VEVLSEELYVTHNFWPAFRDRDGSPFRFPGTPVSPYAANSYDKNQMA